MIGENIERIREKIDKAAKRAGRNPASVVIVCASKGVTPERIEEAIECGIRIIGENVVQDALKKYYAVKSNAEWHMIGHLQTNKINKALDIFAMIQSLDTLHLAEEINKRACKPIPVLIEVNTSGESTKYGFNPDQVITSIRKISNLPNIVIQGLMTIGPLNQDPRPSFKLLRALKDKIEDENIPKVSMQWLSMGMTDDYEIAIEEGSNMVRIGRGIFGERK
ncbi:MAG: YggS family pyridoxal phosphate-dependent enzyme [bacterium]|nr:YggS family pyridoxal phosphate-dependent enzyme [bacterium]